MSHWSWFVLLVGCSGNEAETPEPVDPYTTPDARGFYEAGTFETTVTRSDGLVLPLQVTYPTESTQGTAVAYGGLVPGEALVDAPPACPSPLPVVLFSHGNGGLRYQSVFLTEHLARHGYLVLAPDHVGNTTFDIDTVPRPDVAIRRPGDIAQSFDWLVAANEDPSSPLHQCIDPEAGYALTGHSFGGYTTLATAGARLDLDALEAHCAEADDFLCGAEASWAAQFPDDRSGDLSDPRVTAAIPLAPAGALALGGGLSHVEVPTLVIGGLIDDLTTWEGEVKPLYDGLVVPDRALAGLERTGHYTFTELCVPSLNGCDEADLPLDEAHQWINILVTAWFDTTRGEIRSADFLPPDAAPLEWTAP